METIRVRVFVTGRVQGVFFRANTIKTAQAIGDITGWVRNLPDGRVETVAEGPQEKVDQLVAWLHQGPRIARVDDVEMRTEEPDGSFTAFDVWRG